MRLRKHSLGFLSLPSARSIWNYSISELQSRLKKHTCAHAQLMYDCFYYLVDLHNVPQHILGLNQVTMGAPLHLAPFNPISILQYHLKWSTAHLEETAPHLPKVLG